MVELEDVSDGIILTENQWLSMLADVQEKAPEEACGLLGGTGNRVFALVPITNGARSTSRFRMDPGEQLRAFQRFEAGGLEILGIYHSHPAGPTHPSETDIEESYYPDAVYLIWSKDNQGWECRAFRISDKSFREVVIQIANQ